MPTVPMMPMTAVHQLRCCFAVMLTITFLEAFGKPWVPWLHSNPGGPQVVRLSREPVRALEGSNAAEKSFYVGKLFVGQPQQQEFLVSFDTASGQVVLPTTACDRPACEEHRRYSPEASQSSLDVNADGHPVHSGLRLAGDHKRDALSIGFSNAELGEGRMQGTLIREVVCLGTDLNKDACTVLAVVGAHNMTDVPFRAMPGDGVVGLGLKGLSLNPLFNFFGCMAATRGLRPHFSLYLGLKHGELTIGGYNPSRLESPLWWTAVRNPEEGYWQVSIKSISVGNRTVHSCHEGGCRGIIDSGASNLGVPAVAAASFNSAIEDHRSSGPGCVGANMSITLTDDTILILRAEDYFGHDCTPRLQTLDLQPPFNNDIILGEPLLQRYYTVFDWGSERLGFGVSSALDQGIDGLSAEIEMGQDLEAGQIVFYHAKVLAFRIAIVLLLLLAGPHSFTVQLILVRLNDAAVRSGLTSASLAPLYCQLVSSSECPNADECPICLGSCEEARSKGGPRWRRLNCGHHFHEECIFEWLRKSPSCPVCRRHFQEGCCVKGAQGNIEPNPANDLNLQEPSQ